jgi:hypothetical protein
MGLSCGIGAIICSPVGAVIGAVAGGVTMSEKAAAAYDGGHVGRNAGAIHPDYPKTDIDGFNAHHALAGRFKGYGPLQSGEMYVNTTSIHMTDVPPKRTAYLVVDVGYEMSSSGEASTRSYGVEAVVDCPNPRFSISLRTKWPGVYVMGRWYYVEDITPPLLIGDDTNNPDITLETAAYIVCKG